MSFFNLDFICNIEAEYDEYVWECEQNNIKPLNFNDWWDSTTA